MYIIDPNSIDLKEAKSGASSPIPSAVNVEGQSNMIRGRGITISSASSAPKNHGFPLNSLYIPLLKLGTGTSEVGSYGSLNKGKK